MGSTPAFLFVVFISLVAIASSQSPSPNPITSAVPSSQPVAATDSTTDQSLTSQENASEPVVNPSPSHQPALQRIYISTRKPALGTFQTDEVFKDSHLTASYISCTWDTPTEPNSTDCIQDDKYNDRLTFQITSQLAPEQLHKFLLTRPPSIESPPSAASIASPTISNAVIHDETTATLTVYYNCRSDARGIIPLRMTLNFGESESDRLQIYWQKTCAIGRNAEMTFGYITGDLTQGTQASHEFGQDTATLLKVLPSDITTEFFLKLNAPGSYQEFVAPYVTSSDTNVVSLSVRGNHPRGGVIEGLVLSTFQVVYDCHQQGEATIEANVGIPPFNNVSAVWKKDCGGNAAANLIVGTTEGGFDVVDNGKPTPKFMVGIDHIGTAHSEEHLHLPDNETQWVFYVTNADETAGPVGDTALHVSWITATIEKPEVIYAQKPLMFERSFASWTPVARSPYALAGGLSLKIQMPLICRSVGESRVLITVPVLGHKALEFGIAKECETVGAAHQSNEFMLTVNSLFWGGILLLIGIIASVFIRRRYSAKSAGFEPVPLTER